ncbi:MAG: PorP/SprF family type IX secretion system membrane protein [Reichenbachiella sp.]|uniref:PorP/SprF family type IX secretion system membrane protein n=1 Tax=Reichenbachiella sp. TaxID=2184521 RepID=UPI0032671C10
MKKALLLIFLLNTFFAYGQEGQFSQYFASGALMNPAFPGTITTINFNSNYKRAGKADTESYVELMQGSLTYPLRRVTTKEEYFGSVGLTFFRESRGFQGTYRHQKVIGNFAYVLNLSELRNQLIVFGIQAGYAQQDFSGNGYRWGSQFNQYLDDGYDSSLAGEGISFDPLWYPVINFGALYSTYDNDDYKIRDYAFSVGLSADNLNRPKIGSIDGNDARKSMLYKLFAVFQFPLGARFYGHPSAYVLNSNGSTQLNVGMYVSTFVSSSKSNLGLELQTGGWYRLNDSFIGLIGLKVDQLKLGFSVDLNATNQGLNEQVEGSVSAYEISLGYSFELHKSYRRLSNPMF